MRSFSLVIEYLTGYAVATDAGDRTRAEWPPHPARVFMALAAAHFETDPSDAAAREALDWLAMLSPPDLTVPDATEREVLEVYVPVNDQKAGEALLQRSRQPRTFPRVHVGDEPVRLTWSVDDAAWAERHLDALGSLCGAVSRVGHSSSLVWVRLERDAAGPEPTHRYDPAGLDRRLRVASAGEVDRLDRGFNLSEREAWDALNARVAQAKGKAKKQLKTDQAERFPAGEPRMQRPSVSRVGGYREVSSTPIDGEVAGSVFDPNFLVLRSADQNVQRFGIESTAMATDALRKTIMTKSEVQPVPDWVSGHDADGQPLRTEAHMALVPLAFVGRPWVSVERHATGRVMGVGVLLPRDVSRREAARVFGPLLYGDDDQPAAVTLTLGRAGTWTLERENSYAPKRTLRTETYTAGPGGASSWASVTPVVLDRMPKKDRRKDPAGWRADVAGLVAVSCRRVKLPEPAAVRVEKTPFFHGALRAMPGQGGFPLLRKGRFQVHVQVDFDEPVVGPFALGAGRFRGYGLMRPWREAEAL
ncbi:MAG: type I-U CRISPR-associated protein Csb2 [Planctomycetota bacterium]